MNKAEPIRILHMIGSLNVGGSQTLILNLYRAIDRNRIQFDFVLDHPTERYYEDEVKKLGARIFYMPTFTGVNLLEICTAWDKFFSEHREYKILHTHVRSYASIYIQIAKKYGVKTIVHSHSTSNGTGYVATIKKILQFPLRYQADYCIACSLEAGKWLFGKRVVESKKYQTIRNVISVNDYSMNEKIRRLYRTDLGIDGKTVYMHIGRFHPSKNHLFLLDIFNELLKLNCSAVLVLVGDGVLKTKIEERAKELSIRESVILLGNRNDVPQLLMAADCFLLPSLWEGFSMTVAEAQASGLVCFVSESVPKEVAVSDLVHYVGQDVQAVKWAEYINNECLIRKDVRAALIRNNLDVQAASKQYDLIYQTLLKA